MRIVLLIELVSDFLDLFLSDHDSVFILREEFVEHLRAVKLLRAFRRLLMRRLDLTKLARLAVLRCSLELSERVLDILTKLIL